VRWESSHRALDQEPVESRQPARMTDIMQIMMLRMIAMLAGNPTGAPGW
jgi:hypothetical protein